MHLDSKILVNFPSKRGNPLKRSLFHCRTVGLIRRGLLYLVVSVLISKLFSEWTFWMPPQEKQYNGNGIL